MAIPIYQAYEGTTNFSDTGASMALAANAELTYTVPGVSTARYQALFGFNAAANVYIALNVSATVPSAGTINSSSRFQELRPCKRVVQGGDVLHFITADTTAQVSVSLRAIS